MILLLGSAAGELIRAIVEYAPFSSDPDDCFLSEWILRIKLNFG